MWRDLLENSVAVGTRSRANFNEHLFCLQTHSSDKFTISLPILKLLESFVKDFLQQDDCISY